MTPEMQKKMDELAADYSREDLTVKEDFISGFNAAHDLMQEKVKVLVEALEFYADQDNWIGYHRDCTNIRNDDVKARASDDFEIVVGGKRAREALKGWE